MNRAALEQLHTLLGEFAATPWAEENLVHLSGETTLAEAVESLRELLVACAKDAPEDAEAAVQPFPAGLACTQCFVEAKQAQLAGRPVPDINAGIVLATIINPGGMLSTVLLCEVRHPLGVEPPKLLIAQPGQVPNGFGG